MLTNEEISSALEKVRNSRRPFSASQHSADFPNQLAFTQSKAKFRTADCSRRSGKTEGIAALLMGAVEGAPESVALYLTKTRINAKRIVWGILQRLNREQGLGCSFLESELCMVVPEGGRVYLGGINNREEIEKFRGMPIVLVVIDEAQSIAGYLQELVDEVLAAALMDYDGKVVLVGTPGPVPVGYFYDCIQNPEWEHFGWTVFDNPWILKKSGKAPQEHLDAELKRRGVSVDDPVIQREWFGRWVYDPNSLVFRYEAERNHYDGLPGLGGSWECVVAGDIGWDDADALGVLRWNTTAPDLWLAEEHVMAKQTITQLGNRLREMVDRCNPLSVVLDFGGLGKKIAQELTQRWGLNVKAAEKERKLEHIELLNDALRTGVFHAKKDSRFAQDAMLVEWDRSNPEKPKISDRFHSDAGDMVLYGYREALHWLAVPEQPKAPKPGTPEWQAKHVKAAEEALQAQFEKESEELIRRKREEEDWEAFS